MTAFYGAAFNLVFLFLGLSEPCLAKKEEKTSCSETREACFPDQRKCLQNMARFMNAHVARTCACERGALTKQEIIAIGKGFPDEAGTWSMSQEDLTSDMSPEWTPSIVQIFNSAHGHYHGINYAD